MHQRDVLSDLCQLEHPVERRVSTAEDRQAFAGKLFGVPYAVVNARPLERLNACCPERSRLERANAGRDDNGLGIELLTGTGLDQERIIVLALNDRHFLAEVHASAKRFNLLQKLVSQLLAGAHRDGRNVVDRLVGIQLRALPAGLTNRVDQLRFQPQQAQLEYLKQPTWAGANDDDIRVNHTTTPNTPGAHCRSIGRSLQIAPWVHVCRARLC